MADLLREEEIESRLVEVECDREGDELVRDWKFEDFDEAIAFVNRVAEAAFALSLIGGGRSIGQSLIGQGGAEGAFRGPDPRRLGRCRVAIEPPARPVGEACAARQRSDQRLQIRVGCCYRSCRRCMNDDDPSRSSSSRADGKDAPQRRRFAVPDRRSKAAARCDARSQ